MLRLHPSLLSVDRVPELRIRKDLWNTALVSRTASGRQVKDSLGNMLFDKAINTALGSIEKLVEYGSEKDGS